MGLIATLFITVSCLSPSIAVFIVGSDVIRQVGSGVVICFSAAALFGVAMACVYGELGSAFPSSGGEYTIIGKVLGSRWGEAVLGLNLLGFCISLALSGFAVATYLDAVWPALPTRSLAALSIVIVTGLAIFDIKVGALMTGCFLFVEFFGVGDPDRARSFTCPRADIGLNASRRRADGRRFGDHHIGHHGIRHSCGNLRVQWLWRRDLLR